MITSITLNLRNIGNITNSEVTLVDVPGFQDTESSEIDLANVFSIVKAFSQAK